MPAHLRSALHIAMPIQIGYLDNDGHPRLTIRIKGTHPTAKTVTDALIDTGFTGFLMLPIVQALPLGLALYGTGDYTPADGSTVTNFLADGEVSIMPQSSTPQFGPSTSAPLPGTGTLPQHESVRGTIVLGGDGVLLGMEFMRSLDKFLLVGKVVLLADNAALDFSAPATL
jgi:predicted aspartyl protease